MNISVNFSHTEAPDYIRDHLAEWLEVHLHDLEPEDNLNLKLHCSKESSRSHGDGTQFKVNILASAPWISSTIVVNTSGDKCWETIVDGCSLLRHQLAKSRKKSRSHRHDILNEADSGFMKERHGDQDMDVAKIH